MSRHPNKLSPELIRRNVLRQDSDDCWDWIRSVQTSGYGQIKIDGKNLTAHRASWIALRRQKRKTELVCTLPHDGANANWSTGKRWADHLTDAGFECDVTMPDAATRITCTWAPDLIT